MCVVVGAPWLVSRASHARIWAIAARVSRSSWQRCWSAVSPPSPERLQRREQRIYSFVERLKLARLQNVSVNGETFELPLRSRPTQCQALSPSTLDYLVGFFDGDGCVSSDVNFTSCTLKISQSVDSVEPLTIFQDAFGGTISHKGNGRGFQRPQVQWAVTGRLCRRAASLLGSRPSLKQEQLHIASIPTPTCKGARSALAARLRSLKQSAHPGGVVNSWAYAAGFFDAEGCIIVPPHSCSIQLHVAQKQNPVLSSFQEFIKAQIPDAKTGVYKESNAYFWRAHRLSTSRSILLKMLSGGLVAKRRSAELALNMLPSTHLRIRNEIADIKGYQSAHRRLDAEGCTRAKLIQKVQKQTRRMFAVGDDTGARILQTELDELMREHGLEKIQCRISFARKHARMLLKQGATIE